MREPSFEDLSAYADEAVSPEERGRIEAHVAGCEACRSTVHEIGELKVLARTAAETDVPFHLWPKIAEAALRPTWHARLRQSFRSPIAAWGFAAAMAAIALFAIGRPVTPEARPLDEARRTYIAAIKRLEASATADAARLPAKTQATLLESLASIDRAIAEAERALAAWPEDQEGQQMLLAMYDEKVRVLSAVGQAADVMDEGSSP